MAAAAAACSERPAGNPGNVARPGVALTQAEVSALLAAAAARAQVEGLPAAIAVTDREGEVLGVFTTAARDVFGDGRLDAPGETEVQTAISKAATAAAFQSEAEAFTTRTAFFIVQGHYPPGIDDTPGGPLFGVQDSSLASSDARPLAFDAAGRAVGTGISGELGGVPLYKDGTPVGGIGVDTVAVLRTDALGALTLVTSVQESRDETIARAGALGFEAPGAIDATNVFVDGIALPFYGVPAPAAPAGGGASVPAIPARPGAVDPRFPVRASLLSPEVVVAGRFGLRPTARYAGRLGSRAAPTTSGTLAAIDRTVARLDSATLTFRDVPVVPLATQTFGGVPGETRAPFVDAFEPPPAEGGLTRADVARVVEQAVTNAASSVAGIRLPRGSSVSVSVAVVDVRGNLLGLHRMGDGTLFSLDIAAQKARTAAFFSTDGSGGLPVLAASCRGIGFLAQPFFPPGIGGTLPGPLARLRDLVNRGKVPVERFPSLALVSPPPRGPSDGTTDEDPLTPGFQRFDDFGGAPAELGAVRAILAATGGIAVLADRDDTQPHFVSPGLQSGLQTFPGGVPLYKGARLVGAVGASGDGVDEDDAAAFAGSAGFEPPPGSRMDEVSAAVVDGVLRAKVDAIVAALERHPDARIRNVYAPLARNERARVLDRLARGLGGVRLPYVKLPRNPTDR